MQSTKILRWQYSFPKKFIQKIASVKVSENAKNEVFKARRRRKNWDLEGNLTGVLYDGGVGGGPEIYKSLSFGSRFL